MKKPKRTKIGMKKLHRDLSEVMAEAYNGTCFDVVYGLHEQPYATIEPPTKNGEEGK